MPIMQYCSLKSILFQECAKQAVYEFLGRNELKLLAVKASE
jgi:hypothetical protein